AVLLHEPVQMRFQRLEFVQRPDRAVEQLVHLRRGRCCGNAAGIRDTSLHASSLAERCVGRSPCRLIEGAGARAAHSSVESSAVKNGAINLNRTNVTSPALNTTSTSKRPATC